MGFHRDDHFGARSFWAECRPLGAFCWERFVSGAGEKVSPCIPGCQRKAIAHLADPVLRACLAVRAAAPFLQLQEQGGDFPLPRSRESATSIVWQWITRSVRLQDRLDDYHQIIARAHPRGLDLPLRADLRQRSTAHGFVKAFHLQGLCRKPLEVQWPIGYICPSFHVEGLPSILVEAVMRRCTPVASDYPTGPYEGLEDWRYSFLVTPRDPRSIADRIIKSIDCRLLKEHLSAAIRSILYDVVIVRQFEPLGLSEHTHRVPA